MDKMDNSPKFESNSLMWLKWGLKANREDDCITREIIKIFAQKKLSVDRASRVLEDAGVILRQLSKIPYTD